MRGHAASWWVKWVGAYNKLRPLVFSEYYSATIENTEGKVKQDTWADRFHNGTRILERSLPLL